MRVILAGSRVRESAVGGRNPREAVLLELAEQGGGPSRKNRWTATPHMESASRSPLLARPRRRASVRPASVAGSFALLMVCSITISHPGDQDRPAGTRQGMVRDSAGKPVAGARIRRLSPQISRLCPDPSLGSTENLYLIAGNVGAPSA